MRAIPAAVAALTLTMALAAPAPIARAEPPAAAAAPATVVPRGARAEVTLVTLGRFPPALADAVEAALRRELQVEVRRIDRQPLPPEAWYAPRRRWRADRILDSIQELVPQGARVLGLTDVDISTTKGRYEDWGVFGLGQVGGRAAVLSSFRLRRGARGPEHLRRRVVDVAVHEVGHALGLEHCDETAAHCLMLDAEGSIRTVDTSSGHLGPACRARVDELAPVAR